MKKIYLCGPIKDLSLTEASEWRNNAKKAFENLFIYLDPMRRDFRDDEFDSRNEIVQLDKADIINADVLLVNATKPSWGTAMEIMFANKHHKIIIAFTGDETKNASPWLVYHSTRLFKTMNEAINYIFEQIGGE